MVYGADANSAYCADGVGGMDGYTWDVITPRPITGAVLKQGNTMKIIRTIIAAIFFTVAIVLDMLSIKSENIILLLLSIAAISVAIMVDDNKNRR